LIPTRLSAYLDRKDIDAITCRQLLTIGTLTIGTLAFRQEKERCVCVDEKPLSYDCYLKTKDVAALSKKYGSIVSIGYANSCW